MRGDLAKPGEVESTGVPRKGGTSDGEKHFNSSLSGHCEPAVERLCNIVSHGSEQNTDYNAALKVIFDAVMASGRYNFAGARVPIPSALKIPRWRECLKAYPDRKIVDYLAFGWPINFDRRSPLLASYKNHPSADNFSEDVEHYIATELAHGALVGPFAGPPVLGMHTSPLMTRTKKDSKYRRVIMDLSWPGGAAVNDGVDPHSYVDGPATITLPTADYMADRLLQVGHGAYLYKTDLARGYRQLRVDPCDWPLLGFCYKGKFFLDICPPFGLRSSAMCMQRTAEAIVFIHGKRGFYSKAYLDDFGGAEPEERLASDALTALQNIMLDLGVVEAKHKVHEPAQAMVWLGIWYDSRAMTMTIPQAKMAEIMQELGQWENRVRATRRDMQRLVGLLQFVASVSPPVRIFSNRMLQCLRDSPNRGTHGLSLGFKKDLKFFLDLLPVFNGVRIIDKKQLVYQSQIELDACLTACGATIGSEYYAERFPAAVLE